MKLRSGVVEEERVSGKEKRGAMVVVVVRASLHLAGMYWQQRMRSVRHLNLCVLIQRRNDTREGQLP